MAARIKLLPLPSASPLRALPATLPAAGQVSLLSAPTPPACHTLAPPATRGSCAEFLDGHAPQAARPRAIVDLIRSAEQFRVPGVGDGAGSAALPQPGSCERCGYISSQVCGQCPPPPLQRGLSHYRCVSGCLGCLDVLLVRR